MTRATSIAVIRSTEKETTTCTNENTQHFALSDNIYKLIWLFVLGSITGFLLETAWRLFSQGQLEVRSSVIFGPFNIIYGVGVVVLYLALRKFDKKKKMHIAIWGFIVGTAVEYILALAQEIIFGTISWDYSHLPLNVGGKVCLFFSLAWGAASLLWVYLIYPAVEKLMLKISNETGKKIATILSVFLVINMIVSAVAVMRWQLRIDGIAPMTQAGYLLDTIFPNDFMEVIYSSMSAV